MYLRKEKPIPEFNKFTKIFCAYQGTSDDLLFWGLINTLFLTMEKGLTAGNISLLMTISFVTVLIMRFPSYALIKRIGISKAMMIAAVMFLLSACLFTFGNGMIMLGMAQIMYATAPLLQNISAVFLKENLDRMGKGKEFVKVFSHANAIYASITLVGSCVSGVLFHMNHLLPMLICIGFCMNSLILSVILARYGVETKGKMTILPGRRITIFSKSVIRCMIILSLNAVLFTVCNSNMKLLTQARLAEALPEDKVIMCFSIVIILTRVGKLASNTVLRKLELNQRKNGLLLTLFSAILSLSYIVVLTGCFAPAIPGAFMAGSILIAVAVSFDPIRTIITNCMLDKTSGSQSQTVMSFSCFVGDLLVALSSGAVTVIMSVSNLYAVAALLFIVSIIMLTLCMTWRNKIYHESTAFSYYDLDKTLNEQDSLVRAAAFQLRHYNILRKGRGMRLIEKTKPGINGLSDNGIISVEKMEKYDFNCLRKHYEAGHPCAIEITVGDNAFWLPVIYMDDDDAILADFQNQNNVFLSDYQQVSRICSFRI